MRNNYIVLYNKAESENLQFFMYKDLNGKPDVTLCARAKDSPNKFLHFFYLKIRNYIINERPGYGILYKYLKKHEDIQRISFSDKKTNVIIINDMGLQKYYVSILLELKKKHPNTVFVVHWLNVTSTVPPMYFEQMKRLKPAIVLTDDPGDSEKFGWIFWMDCISDISSVNSGKKSDVFFAGIAKDREEQILDAYWTLTQNGLNCDFTIVGKTADIPQISGKYIIYKELLSRDKATNCILEIMQKGQTGYTCRAQEAIIFNKKLLTNNKWITKSRYYNPLFIKVFDKIGKEEIEFVKEQVFVDYKYDGSFSPIKLIEYLDGRIQ